MAIDNKAGYSLKATELLYKFGYAAKYCERLKTRDPDLPMKRRIADYEKKHEKIPEEVYRHKKEN